MRQTSSSRPAHPTGRVTIRRKVRQPHLAKRSDHGATLSTTRLKRVIASAPIKIDDDPAEAERLAAEVRREMRRVARRGPR